MFREARACDTPLLVRHGCRMRLHRSSAPAWVDSICDRAGAARFIGDFSDRSCAATGAAWFLVPDGEIRAGAIHTLMPGLGRVFELGVWCEGEFRGRGLVGDGLARLWPFAAQRFRVDAVVARTSASNQAARKLFERLGLYRAQERCCADEVTYCWRSSRLRLVTRHRAP
jgi:RimJ/RimL family protein N-acetyltransferase